jgi:hypothetical protein
MEAQFVARCNIEKEGEDFLENAPAMNRFHRDASALLAHAAENIGRFLLVLAAVELVSMPLTQYAWNWDHFLHGGVDFESSLLLVVICLGLLLVLRHHFRQDANSRVPRRRFSLPLFDTDNSTATPGTRVLLAFRRQRQTGLDLVLHSLPLQI